MKNLIQLLRENKKIQDKNKKENGGYGMLDTPHLPEILTLNKQYRKENPKEYGYNRIIAEYITKKEHIPQELQDILNTQVYFSQKDLDNERKEQYKNEMIKQGWEQLTMDTIKKAVENKKRLEVKATMSNDWLTNNINETYKPFITQQGEYYLMKLKARSRGIALYHFENAFCKLI